MNQYLENRLLICSSSILSSFLLSMLALDCIDKCEQEVKEEAKKMQRVQTKLKMAETKDPQKTDEKYKSNSTKTFLERLERMDHSLRM